MSSILTDTKKAVGIAAEYDVFDVDILMHINSVFGTLNQLGLGPDAGYMIEDDTEEWEAFLGDDLRLNPVKSYVYLRVRMLFDPPQTSFHISAIKEQIQELEWRLNVHREGYAWSDPDPDVDEDVVLDGGQL